MDHVDGSVAPTTKDHVVMPSANVTSTTRVHVVLIEPAAGVTGIGSGGIDPSKAFASAKDSVVESPGPPITSKVMSAMSIGLTPEAVALAVTIVMTPGCVAFASKNPEST